MQLAALVDMLSNIILRDDLHLDLNFLDHWAPYNEIFRPVSDAGLVLLTSPIIQGSEIDQGTAFIVKELCVTPGLKRIQSINEKHFAAHRQSKYEYQSQIMWGGAGMLARSSVNRIPYVGHPLRQHFFESTGALNPQRDLVKDVVQLVKEKRASIYAMTTSTMNVKHAQVYLPAVAVEAIMEADSSADLLRIAIDLRDKHKRLRKWFGTFREALDKEDTGQVAQHQKQLNLLVRDIDRMVGRSSSPSFSVGMSASGPSASLPIGEWARNFFSRFQVRHDLMKQVKAPSSEVAMKKLKRLFGA